MKEKSSFAEVLVSILIFIAVLYIIGSIDHDGIALNYEAVGRAVRGITKSRNCSVELDDAWANDIAEYHDKAGKR